MLHFYCDAENLYLYFSSKILLDFFRYDPGYILFILVFKSFNMQTIYLNNTENFLTRMVLLPNLSRIKSRKKHVSEIYNHSWKNHH